MLLPLDYTLAGLHCSMQLLGSMWLGWQTVVNLLWYRGWMQVCMRCQCSETLELVTRKGISNTVRNPWDMFSSDEKITFHWLQHQCSHQRCHMGHLAVSELMVWTAASLSQKNRRHFLPHQGPQTRAANTITCNSCQAMEMPVTGFNICSGAQSPLN